MTGSDWRTVPGRYIKDPRLGHRLGRSYPGGEISDEDWGIYSLGTDQDGFVFNSSSIRDYSLGDHSLRRVFVLGGSTTMGMGVRSNNETFCSQLENLLRVNDERFRVLNCAVGSYMSWQQLTYLSLELILHKPDFIVVLDGVNDFCSSTWGNKGGNGDWIPNTHRSLDDIVQIVLQATGETKTVNFLSQKFLRSRFGKWIENLSSSLQAERSSHRAGVATVWGNMDYRQWRLKDFAPDCYLTNVRNTVGVAHFNGARIIYAFQPQMIWGERKLTPDENQLLEKIKRRMPPIPELAPKWFNQVRPAFRTMANQFQKLNKTETNSIVIEDASSWLDDVTETVYHDWCHYNAHGQRHLAEKFATLILGTNPSKDHRPMNTTDSLAI